jgi:hypothetical protein
MLPAGMDVKPASQRPGRRSSAGLIAAPCPMRGLRRGRNQQAGGARALRVRSCPTNRRQCAFGCVKEKANVERTIKQAKKANVETIKQANSEAQTGYGEIQLQSENSLLIPVEMATPWLTDTGP